jgi:hypothetical protein
MQVEVESYQDPGLPSHISSLLFRPAQASYAPCLTLRLFDVFGYCSDEWAGVARGLLLIIHVSLEDRTWASRAYGFMSWMHGFLVDLDVRSGLVSDVISDKRR